ncbi:G patch domain-containing protein 11 [Nilaparvata lugens]|uniref:G patch domain-containing protein 11 n=1 Tax=Nilaparvata lugens TaxID=108931 RepID=UPI000B983B19|nr:G patch domain-containing protein 11 [Nilaparvata lugens]
MSSEEEDYMSDAFLTGCVQEDIRPGLVHNRSLKRRYEMDKKKTESDDINKKVFKKAHVVEKELREDGLSQPISEDNKGFKMLQKLGFKPGSGLGKSQEGCKEPIPINVKSDRQGLGRTQAVKELLEKKAAILKERQNKALNVTDYRAVLAQEAAQKRAEIDFRKAQKVCQQLDTENGFEPFEYWYWPVSKSNDNEEEFIDEDTDAHIESKQTISVCNEDAREGGGVGGGDGIEGEEETYDEDEDVEEEDNEDNYTIGEKLEMLTGYLRQTHYYCIWCGTRYEDEQDMDGECPGPTYDEH